MHMEQSGHTDPERMLLRWMYIFHIKGMGITLDISLIHCELMSLVASQSTARNDEFGKKKGKSVSDIIQN